MESAKTQKWSHSQPTTEADEFTPFVAAAASAFNATVTPIAGAPEFRVQNGYWEDMIKDPDFQRDYFRRVSEEVRRRLESEFESLRKQYLEEGKNEGRTLGINEGRAELQRLQRQLEALSSEIATQKETLLREHEAELSDCLRHLVSQFMLAGKTDLVPSIEKWIAGIVDEFKATGGVTVYLSKAEFDRFSSAGITGGERWKVEMDENLKEGEVRCSCSTGGALFSRPAQWQKLEAILQQYFATDGKV